jgi:hypothetical protein
VGRHAACAGARDVAWGVPPPSLIEETREHVAERATKRLARVLRG